MPTDLTVMTWNLENLFPVGNPSGPTSEEAYQNKLANLAETILQIAPDVLAVQEVGSPDAITDLQGRLQGRYPHQRLSDHPDTRGIRVGILATLPFDEDEELVPFPDSALLVARDRDDIPIRQMGRGAVRITVMLESGLRVHVVTAHLKSKLITYANGRRNPTDEDERARETGLTLIRRTAEAVALRVYVDSLITGNDDALVLLGDLNDGPQAVTTQILLGPEDGSLQRRDRFDDVRLYNLADSIPSERRYSRMYRKQRELIDHILVSHDLIFKVQQVNTDVETITSIDEGTESRRDAAFPDHAPVFARFDLA